MPHPGDNFSLVFIVNGQEMVEAVQPNQPLKAARNHALAASGNTGRSFDEWEVRDVDGTLLDANRTITELGLVAGARLFVNIKVGAGG